MRCKLCSLCPGIMKYFVTRYSAFEVPCSDRDLTSALDHVAVINERHDSSFRIRNSNCVSTLLYKDFKSRSGQGTSKALYI